VFNSTKRVKVAKLFFLGVARQNMEQASRARILMHLSIAGPTPRPAHSSHLGIIWDMVGHLFRFACPIRGAIWCPGTLFGPVYIVLY